MGLEKRFWLYLDANPTTTQPLAEILRPLPQRYTRLFPSPHIPLLEGRAATEEIARTRTEQIAEQIWPLTAMIKSLDYQYDLALITLWLTQTPSLMQAREIAHEVWGLEDTQPLSVLHIMRPHMASPRTINQVLNKLANAEFPIPYNVSQLQLYQEGARAINPVLNIELQPNPYYGASFPPIDKASQ